MSDVAAPVTVGGVAVSVDAGVVADAVDAALLWALAGLTNATATTAKQTKLKRGRGNNFITGVG